MTEVKTKRGAFIAPRFTTVAFSFMLSLMMSFIVSGISTVRSVGLSNGLLALWMENWFASFLVAFPAVLVVAPLARKIVARFTVEG
ncbi:MAG: DUF2798 domain-containing protein [Pseudomonadota bacterium]